MSQSKIERLTPEQEALIPVYREKWRSVAFSTERIERKQASEAVKAAYIFSGLSEPEVIFLDSPFRAWSYYFEERTFQWGTTVRHLIYHGLQFNVGNIGLDKLEFMSSLEKYLWLKLVDVLNDDVRQVTDAIEKQTKNQLSLVGEPPFVNYIKSMLHTEEWACCSSYYDYCVSVLDCECEPWEWIAYRSVAMYCGWLLPTTKVCIVCDRPTKLSFDSEGRLHSEVEPAIQFADGFKVYAHHGKLLPEQ